VCVLWRVQALSNSVWGFAKLGARDEALLDAVAQAALAKLHEFKAQNLANLVRPGDCSPRVLWLACC
jgi:hypothetical protein